MTKNAHVDGMVIVEYLGLLSEKVDSVADWRLEKAAEYPHDAKRNLQAAEALRKLAEGLRQLSAENGAAAEYVEFVVRAASADLRSNVYSLDSIINAEDNEIRIYGFYAPADGNAEEFLNVLSDLLFEDALQHAYAGLPL